MLPDGFHLRSYLDGPALYLEARMVAMLTPIESVAFRIDLDTDCNARRSLFKKFEGDALRYVEACARGSAAASQGLRDGTAKGI